jgi:molecular chaperone HscC
MMIFKVYQGENMYCDENLYLGQIDIYVPPAPKGKEIALVRMSYDIDGILEIEVTNKSLVERKVLYNKDLALSDPELEEKLTRLSKLKIHPREQEENQMILARGDRLYKENLGSLRETIMNYIHEFERLLNTQEERDIRKAREYLNTFFNYIDRADRKEQEEYFEKWLSEQDEEDLS